MMVPLVSRMLQGIFDTSLTTHSATAQWRLCLASPPPLGPSHIMRLPLRPKRTPPRPSPPAQGTQRRRTDMPGRGKTNNRRSARPGSEGGRRAQVNARAQGPRGRRAPAAGVVSRPLRCRCGHRAAPQAPRALPTRNPSQGLGLFLSFA